MLATPFNVPPSLCWQQKCKALLCLPHSSRIGRWLAVYPLSTHSTHHCTHRPRGHLLYFNPIQCVNQSSHALCVRQKLFQTGTQIKFDGNSRLADQQLAYIYVRFHRFSVFSWNTTHAVVDQQKIFRTHSLSLHFC